MTEERQFYNDDIDMCQHTTIAIVVRNVRNRYSVRFLRRNINDQDDSKARRRALLTLPEVPKLLVFDELMRVVLPLPGGDKYVHQVQARISASAPASETAWNLGS